MGVIRRSAYLGSWTLGNCTGHSSAWLPRAPGHDGWLGLQPDGSHTQAQLLGAEVPPLPLHQELETQSSLGSTRAEQPSISPAWRESPWKPQLR